MSVHPATPGSPAAQAVAPHPVYVMPMPERNGLGLFGFVVAVVGLVVPSGIVSILGLILSLAAIGRAPRGFATAGVIVGLLGTVFWAVVMVGLLALGVAALGVAMVATAGAFVLAQPEVVEVTGDMVNLVAATQAYEEEHGALPADIGDLRLTVPSTLDPWGHAYRFAAAPDDRDYELTFSIVSAGPDGTFGTEDDLALERLRTVWKRSLDDFEGRMVEFGHRFDNLEAAGWEGAPTCPESFERFSPEEYLRRAVIQEDETDGPD